MNRFERAVRWFGACMLALVVLMPGASPVSAHAVPERAYPEMNTAVPVMPALIEVWFSEEVKSEGTTLEVLKLDGTKVDLGNTTLDLQDPNRSLVTVGVHDGLDNGAYVVQWTSVSAVDGDSVSGSYQFIVDPTASPQALPQIATQQAPVQLPVIEDDDDSNSTDRNPLLYGIVAAVTGVAMVGLIVFWFFRRPSHGKRWSDRPVDRL
ncbi:MAG TPA: copper resistance protein CopC [Thermomicrobiales bacterium]|nr:copper resistance protein CopC [Thermomicrobiales bacterium]